MNLELQRFSSGVESTLGLLFEVADDGLRFLCYTLEDQFNEPKVPKETRIPEGRYRVKLRTDSPMATRYKERFPWHRGMLWLQDVPDFSYVYIHVGNKDDDTDGCILVGDGQSQNITDNGSTTSSVTAYRRIYDRLVTAIENGNEVWINIEDIA